MSSDFSEFLAQPFISGILSLMCFVTLLLIATIAGIVYMRRRKAQQKLAASMPPSFVGESTYSAANMDMPDLNLLMHTPAAAPKPAPVVRAAPPPPAPIPTAAPQRQARKGTFTVTPKDGSATEAVEVLSLLRDVVDGSLIVQMGDKSYQNVNSDPEFKDKFNRLMRELGQLISKPAAAVTEHQMDVAASDVETVDLPPPAPEAVRSAEPSFLAPKKSAAPPPTYDGKMPGDLPSFKLDDNPMQKLKRGQKPSEVSPVPELNIAGAIEAYLQYKLSHSSMYAERSIHIYPAPGGGVSIEVDGQYFDAVSDVTDSSVREFLSETIAEWQERH